MDLPNGYLPEEITQLFQDCNAKVEEQGSVGINVDEMPTFETEQPLESSKATKWSSVVKITNCNYTKIGRKS